MTQEIKEKFAKFEMWESWDKACEGMSNCQNEFLLDYFINKYIEFSRKNKRPVLEKCISILEESLELMSKVKSQDEDILKNYRELIGETARLKEYIKINNY